MKNWKRVIGRKKWMTVGFMEVSCPLCCSAGYLFAVVSPSLSPGGPVPQVGVTIAMDNQLLNGTNRVVLDGVMTEKECGRILHLATVSWERERRSRSKAAALTRSLTRLVCDRLQDLPETATKVEGLRTRPMRRLRVWPFSGRQKWVNMKRQITPNQLNEISVRIKCHIMYFRCSVGIF